MMMMLGKALVEVLNQAGSFTQIRYDADAMPVWVRSTKLKTPRTPRETKMQKALRMDPEALNLLVPYVRRILISSVFSDVDRLATELSEVSGISEIDAVDYIKPVSEASHGGKFDIIIAAETPAELQTRLGVFFKANGKRAHKGEAQINSRSLAEWLMKEHNLVPQKANVPNGSQAA